MIEIWKDVLGYEGLYQVSSLGRVRSLDRYIKGKSGCSVLRKGCVFNGDCGDYGKVRYSLQKKRYMAHILVAKAFSEICGAWFDGCEVHHKDGNPSNNIATNLICLSHSEHIDAHKELGKWSGERNSFYGKKHKKESIERMVISKSKPILQYSLDGEFIAQYQSCTEAERQLGFSKVCINKCCQNKQYTAYGFKWRYA